MSTPTTVYQLDKPAVGGDADVWGGITNTNWDDVDVFLARPRRKKNAPVIGAGLLTLDLALANFFEFTVDAAITTFTISNVPATLPDTTVPFIEIVLKITNGGLFAITWPGSFVWSGGAAPALAAAGVDFVVARSYDAGTTWYAHVPHFVNDPTLNPRASVYHSANQDPGAATVALAFNTERFDVGVMHDTVTNNSRLTVPAGQGGLYQISFHFQVLFVNDPAAGQHTVTLRLRKNGVTTLRDFLLSWSGDTVKFEPSATVLEVLAAADYVEILSVAGAIDVRYVGGLTANGFEIVRLR